MENTNFTVTEEQAGERADKILAAMFECVSRTHVQKNFASGNIICNGKPITQKYRLELGDNIEAKITAPEETSLKPANIALDILFEDDDIIIVNKQTNLTVHAAPGIKEPTLVEGILAHCQLSPLGGDQRPGVVHRLDKETTGAIMFAKSNIAYMRLINMFKKHRLDKIYHTIVAGNPQIESGFVDKAIDRNPVIKTKMAICAYGKDARSDWKVLERFGKFSLLQVKILTGRTHQIRVHMSSINYPVAGDGTYGFQSNYCKDITFPRVMLHAKFLSFIHPISGENIEIDAPYPTDFANSLNELRVLQQKNVQ